MQVFEEFINLIGDPGIEINLLTFVFAIAVASIMGLVVASLYHIFYEHRATGSQIHRSFFLMAPSITTLFIAIQFSLPLSLGLLGALSIVRFRTPVKEPEEIGFLMLLIACSVVCATLQFALLVVLLVFAILLLLTMKLLPRFAASKRTDGMVLISMDTVSDTGVCDKLIGELSRLLPNGRLERVSTTDELTTISYAFLGFRSLSIDQIRTSLTKVAPLRQVNVFFNSQGTLF